MIATPEANPAFILLKNQKFIVETGTPCTHLQKILFEILHLYVLIYLSNHLNFTVKSTLFEVNV